MSVVRGDVSVGAGAGVGAVRVAAQLRARRRLDALVDVGAQVRVLGVRPETGPAPALVAHRLVDAQVRARVHRLALVHVCVDIRRNNKKRFHQPTVFLQMGS